MRRALLFSWLLVLAVATATPAFAVENISPREERIVAAEQILARGITIRTRTDQEDQYITRTEFFTRAADRFVLGSSSLLQDLDISVVTDDRAFMANMRKKGALRPLKGPLNEEITLTEALQSLMILAGIEEYSYRDLDSTESSESFAARMALYLEWIEPKNNNYLGLQEKMTEDDADKLLEQVARFREQESQLVLPYGDVVTDAWNNLNRYYLHPEDIDDEQAIYRAIEGMMESVGDRYTTYQSPDQEAAFEDSIGGEYEGIGAYVEYLTEDGKGYVTIVAPLEGSPADEAGLLPGDRVLKANGEDLVDNGLLYGVSKIKGRQGTHVELEISRNVGGRWETLTKSVERRRIVIKDVETEIDGDVAIVTLRQFGTSAEAEFRNEIAKLDTRTDIVGIIVDLRSNGGGLVSSAEVVTSAFLPRGSVVSTIVSHDDTYDITTMKDPILSEDTPLVILVGPGSASASEMFAGAMQDAGRATIIGQTTFGKGSAQTLIPLRRGSVKITFANFFTPDGHKIDGIGITPDITVGDDEDSLRRAKDYLRWGR